MGMKVDVVLENERIKKEYYRRIIEIEIIIIILLLSIDLLLFFTTYELLLIPIFLKIIK
jgi:NADH:ubiquinone oxidoreductase subunit 4 (subunit M)